MLNILAAVAGFSLHVAPPAHLSTAPSPVMTADTKAPSVSAAAAAIKVDLLQDWLVEAAGIHPKFVGRVMEVCENEMIGSVDNLRTAHSAGLFDELFKPVVALSIVEALGIGAGGAATMRTAPDEGTSTVEVPLNLEVEPYHAIVPNLPINTFKPKKPHQAAITSVKRVVGANAPGEVCHVEIDTGGAVKYWEGQSLGVLPPGTDPKTGKPNSVRLYSIASTRYGDNLKGTSVSLCVRRATYWCPELKAEDPAKKGVCSNFLCDATPGAAVNVCGPTGKVMLMPEHAPATDLIMVATGTGIAPYRGFLRRLFVEANTPASQAYAGLAWLFLGVATTEALLYADDWAAMAAR